MLDWRAWVERMQETPMRGLIALALAAALVLATAQSASTDGAMIEDLTMQPKTGWRFSRTG